MNSEEVKYKSLKGKRLSLKVHSLIDKHVYLLIGIIATALAITIRYLSALHSTNDVVGFIFVWMKNIEKVGFKNFYTIASDYSPLYLFIIALFTLLPKASEDITINNYTFNANWMYYIKSMMFVMDILIAIGIYLVVKHVTKDKMKGFIGYIVALFLPCQFLNSAIWGNSDSMYFTCFIFIIYFILKKKDHLAWFFFGLAFSLKMQSIFILPFMIYLVISRRLKIYPIYMVFIALMLSFAPSYICGASFAQPFTYIAKEVGGYSQLTLGCANMWHLIDVQGMDSFSHPLNKASLFIGLGIIFVLTAIVYLRKVKMTDQNIVLLASFLIGIIPFFLPHMHERYFYALDVLVLVYALTKIKKRIFLVPLMQLSSFIAYYHYLSGYKKYFIQALGEDSVHIAVFINIAVLTILFIDIFKADHRSLKDDRELESKEIEETKSINEKLTFGIDL